MLLRQYSQSQSTVEHGDIGDHIDTPKASTKMLYQKGGTSSLNMKPTGGLGKCLTKNGGHEHSKGGMGKCFTKSVTEQPAACVMSKGGLSLASFVLLLDRTTSRSTLRLATARAKAPPAMEAGARQAPQSKGGGMFVLLSFLLGSGRAVRVGDLALAN